MRFSLRWDLWPSREGTSRSCCGLGDSPEFQQVVRQADELPFGLHLAESSHHELLEAASLFDLTAVYTSPGPE